MWRNQSEPPPSPLVQPDGQYFEVDRILVRLKGYDNSSDDSWLCTREFRTQGLRKMIRDFNLSNASCFFDVCSEVGAEM